MSAKAVGAYLRILRTARQLKLQQIAEAVGTSISQISRIEHGDQETRASIIFGFASVVQANLDHLSLLFRDKTATIEDGEQFAREWVVQSGINPNIRTHPGYLAAIGAYVRTLRRAQYLTRPDVAALAGIETAALYRIEHGADSVDEPVLLAIIPIIQGRPDHITNLAARADISAIHGYQMAFEWLKELDASTAQEQQAELEQQAEIALEEQMELVKQSLSAMPTQNVVVFQTLLSHLKQDSVSFAYLLGSLHALMMVTEGTSDGQPCLVPGNQHGFPGPETVHHVIEILGHGPYALMESFHVVVRSMRTHPAVLEHMLGFIETILTFRSAQHAGAYLSKYSIS